VTYRCEQHGHELTVDEEHRHWSATVAGGTHSRRGGAPAMGCELFRLAHLALERPEEFVGEQGPWVPGQAGFARKCRISQLG
jgi:hypothetical protein